MTRTFEFNGVIYTIDTTEQRTGQWMWSYQIEDGRHGLISDMLLPSEELALNEAKNAAEFRIGRT